MAVGKNKRKAKKTTKKKTVDPFSRKEWYEIKAPNLFANRTVGYTLVNRTQGTKIASESLKGRIFEANLADLQSDEDQGHRKFRLRCEDVSGRQVLTNFYGMDLTTDKYKSLVRKWQTLIEATVDVKTTDGYTLRLFLLTFTKRRPNQQKNTCYAQSSQVRQIRARIVNCVKRETANCELSAIVQKFIPGSIEKQVEKECASIFPLKDTFVRKCKVLRAPKLDPFALLALHQDGAAPAVAAKKADTGKRVQSAKKQEKKPKQPQEPLVGEN